MRLQHRHLGVEGGLDLGELDLPLRLNLEMDRVVLRLLLLELRLMRCERGVDLRAPARPIASDQTAAACTQGCFSKRRLREPST
jgi:hypothetical protein